MAQKRAKRRGRQKGASAAELARARAKQKRIGKFGGRPRKFAPAGAPLEQQIRLLASQGVQDEDIAVKLGLVKRLPVDEDLRRRFEDAIALGRAEFRIELAQKLYQDGVKSGKVTAQIELARAYLEAFMDEAPMRDFAAGVYERVLAIIEKAKRSAKDRKAEKAPA